MLLLVARMNPVIQDLLTRLLTDMWLQEMVVLLDSNPLLWVKSARPGYDLEVWVFLLILIVWELPKPVLLHRHQELLTLKQEMLLASLRCLCSSTEYSRMVGLGLKAGVSYPLAALHPSSGLIGIVCHHCVGAGRTWEKVSSIFANNRTNYLYLYAVLSRGV